MIKLIRYELKKLFSMKAVLVLMVFVVISNVVLMTLSFDEAKISQDKLLKAFVNAIHN